MRMVVEDVDRVTGLRGAFQCTGCRGSAAKTLRRTQRKPLKALRLAASVTGVARINACMIDAIEDVSFSSLRPHRQGLNCEVN